VRAQAQQTSGSAGKDSVPGVKEKMMTQEAPARFRLLITQWQSCAWKAAAFPITQLRYILRNTSSEKKRKAKTED
jgi:hypothetical protein